MVLLRDRTCTTAQLEVRTRPFFNHHRVQVSGLSSHESEQLLMLQPQSDMLGGLTKATGLERPEATTESERSLRLYLIWRLEEYYRSFCHGQTPRNFNDLSKTGYRGIMN